MNRLILSAALLTLLGAPAMAQDHGEGSRPPRHGPEALFSRADVNDDGRITRSEFNNASASLFAKLDANHDGVITREEARPAHRNDPKVPDHNIPPSGGDFSNRNNDRGQ